jgi:hypothetical protein
MLGLFGVVALHDKRKHRAIRLWLALAILVSAMGLGCAAGSQGNSSNPNGTPAGTYNVSVQAIGNGNTTHSTTVVLTVN